MMIEINLLPEDMRRKEGLKFSLPDLPVGRTVVIAFAAFFLIQLGLLAFGLVQGARIAGLQREIERLKAENKDITRQKEDIAAMDSRLKEIDDLTARRHTWAALLGSLVRSVTKGVWLTGFQSMEANEIAEAMPGQKKGTQNHRKVRYVKIDGSAVGQGQETAFVGKFIRELKADPLWARLFSDVKLSNLTQKKIRDIDVYDFVLTCNFKESA